MITITGVKSILDRKFAGANIDDIQGISDFSLFKEAAVNLLVEISPAETTRRTTIEVLKDVFDYDPPSDFRGLIDARTQKAFRANNDNATRRFSEEFDQEKNLGDFTKEWRDGDKLLRYSRIVGTGNIGIHNMDTLADNGTWDGTASNIALTKLNPFRGSGAIAADYDTGEYIENDNMTAVDLSDHENKSILFLAGYFPDASLVTDVNLRWGNDVDTNFFNRTVTAPQFGSFKNGWNLIPFAWDGATETGTVDTEKIDSIRITLTLSSSDTDIWFDDIFSALGEFRDFIYYSNAIFRTSAGVFKETPTLVTDIINLDTDAENLYVYECIRLAALGLQGRSVTYKTYSNILYGGGDVEVGAYARYKQRTPEEDIPPRTQHRRIRWNKK